MHWKVDFTVKTQRMEKNPKVLILNLPSPPNQRLWRDTAGGFGTAIPRRYNYKQNGETALHPFLPYASSILLEAGYEFNVLDCQRLKLTQPQVLDVVKRKNPDVIFSVLSLPSMKNDIKILNEIKETIQHLTIVGVGTVCRVIPNEVLLKSKIDVILRNSYPYISNMTALIQAFQYSKDLKTVNGISYIENGQIINTPESPKLDLGDLPVPCYDFIQFDGYETFTDTTGERFPYVPILESRGCPYNCIYCPYPLGFGREWTFRPLKAIVAEIEYLRTVHNIRGFLLRGQTFAYNRKRAMEISEEIIQRKLDIAWFCESRVDEVNRELLERMKKAGCERIHYGVETGDPETLKIAKPGVKLETIKRAFNLTKKTGLITQAHVILGWPDDDEESLENTRKFLLSLDPDVINLNFLTPYPGTKMYELARQNSLLLTSDWSNYTSHKVVMKTKYLNANQLYAAGRRIIRDHLKRALLRLILEPETYLLKHPRLFIGEARKLIGNIISQ